MNVTIQIDGKKITVAQGTNVLEAALTNGIYIPHLCHHPDLPELGSCRLCLVEVEGQNGVTPSCKLKAEEGMVITTKSEQIDHLRKLSMELLLAAHPEDCSTCPKYGKCELQTLIQYMGVSAARMHTRVKGFAQNDKNPLLIHDMNRCVLCGRCVRACNDLRGVGTLQYDKEGLEVRVGTLHNKLLKDANCRFCGACAEVCPTGTIRDMVNWSPSEKKEKLLPCQAACPAHVDVPKYIRFIAEENFSAAAAVVREKLPFPECLGYICVHNCESQCRHACLNAAVSIRNLKRFASQHDDGSCWKDKVFHKAPTGKKIAVVGGGPAGLTVALYGAKLGHSITIFEVRSKLGGQMRYGIPSYRLPRETVDAEINDILSQGDISVVYNTEIKNAPELLKQGFDAVFVSIGTHQGARLPITGSNLDGVTVNADFLRAFEEGTAAVGENVVVLGGGNVAIDCAGAAFRLGAKTVHMACLEAYDAMTASDEERAWALEEGVQLHNSKTFPEIQGENGHCTGVVIQSIGNFRRENGRMVFDKLEGTQEVLPADTVIFATGQRPTISNDPADFGLALTHGNYIAADSNNATSVQGIWAAGDVVTGTQSVIKAVAGARNAISQIDRYLGGDGVIEEHLAPEQSANPCIGCQPHFADIARTQPNVVPVPERVTNWKTCGAMDKGFDLEKVRIEANRCLQCDLRFTITEHRLWSDYTADAQSK